MSWISYWGSGYYSNITSPFGAAQKNNAILIRDYLLKNGFYFNSIMAILGNMMKESYLNPGQWQHGYKPWDGNRSNGMGLVGWTPYWRITDWLTSHGYSLDNPESYGYGMLDKLIEECFDPQEVTWIKTSKYPLSFREFATDTTHDIGWLANAFLYNYERPAVTPQPDRAQNAIQWSEILKGSSTTVIEKAVSWARKMAADNSHGYDQAYRWGPDYDCSSLLIQAWENAGVPVKTNGATYTGNMKPVFLMNGFSDVTAEINLSNGSGLEYGDIVLNYVNHTAMYIGNGKVVQASSNEFGGITGGETGDQNGREIWETNYYNFPWNCVLRYTSGGSIAPPSGGISFIRWIPA